MNNYALAGLSLFSCNQSPISGRYKKMHGSYTFSVNLSDSVFRVQPTVPNTTLNLFGDVGGGVSACG